MEKNNIKLNLTRETLVDRIVEILENRILTGELEPKTKLSEISVAKEYGVSRAPAREALQRLEEMNLVRKTHLGREVAEFTLDEFRQIFELKNVVEAFGVMQGALNATNHDIKKIQSTLDKMSEIINHNGQLENLRRLNFQFHDLLVNCSNNDKVVKTYISLAKQVRWAAHLSLSILDRPTQSTMEHQAIFEAFKQKKPEKARILMEKHTNGSMERILSRLKSKKQQ